MLKEEILTLLRESDGYLSGEEISRNFGVSRSAVWKNINLLRDRGYQIESVTNRGYRLTGIPDKMLPEEIEYRLGTKEIGRMVVSLETVDSTNEEAKRQEQKGAPHGAVFTTEQQTGGKGRLGRSWVAPKGLDIAFTILLRTPGSPLHASNITLLSGMAVCKAIRDFTGCPAMIKWPNDVVIGGKKVCGILTEIDGYKRQTERAFSRFFTQVRSP